MLTSDESTNCALGEDFHFPKNSFVHTYKDIEQRIKARPALMKDAIVAFESLGPRSMWEEARIALNI